MPELLICTVGGAPQPLVASILSTKPDRIVFVCSADTSALIDYQHGVVRSEGNCQVCGEASHECLEQAGIVQRLERAGWSLDPGRWETLCVPDAQDLETCVERMHRQLTPEVEKWGSRGANYRVVADFTGGTKCMSVALGLVARRWPCRLRYVGGAERNKGGVGVVVSGREQLIHSRNPWDALGYQVAEEAFSLFDQGDYTAAFRQLSGAAKSAEEPRLRRAFQTFAALADALHHWELFNHGKAKTRFDDVEKNANDLHEFLDEARVSLLLRQITSWRAHLESLTGLKEPSLELVADLLANGQRRMAEGRYDDAGARLYRAIEAIAQVRLRGEPYKIRTEDVPLDAVPSPLREAWVNRAQDQPLRLALQDAYLLLDTLGDPLATRFKQLHLADEASPLVIRNQSILAHGFQTVSEKACERLWEAALDLSGLDADKLPHFPRLRDSD